MKLTMALDSGAHSIYHKYSVKKDGWQDKVASNVREKSERNYDFYASQEFEEYLTAYVKFVKESGNALDFHVNLDAIFNPELSYQMYQRLRKLGLKPLPVLHPGEDVKWLKKYMEDTDYVGLGGVGQEWTRHKYWDWAKAIFLYLGWRPGYADEIKTKVHGFAMTSLPLVSKLPWFSVDSTTPWYMGRCGTLLLPKERTVGGKKRYDFLAPHRHVAITKLRSGASGHIFVSDKMEQKSLQDYLDIFGLSLEGAQSSWEIRGFVNYYRMHMMERALNEIRPFRYYMSGVRHDGWPTIFIEKCKLVGISPIHYLGSHFEPKLVEQMLSYMKGSFHLKPKLTSRPLDLIVGRQHATA